MGQSSQGERAPGERLRTLERFFDLSLELFCTVDPTLHFAELNAAWVSVLGYSLDELRASPFSNFLHPDDLDATRQVAERMLTTAAPAANFLNRYRHRDGHYVPLLWSGRARDGVIFATARDLSSAQGQEATIKLRERELRESAARLRAVFDAMDEGVVLQLADGRIAASNAAAGSLLGVTETDLQRHSAKAPLWTAVREDGSPFAATDRPAPAVLRSGIPQTNVVMGLQRSSGVLWLTVNSWPLFHEGESAPYAVVSTFRDITEERKAAERSALLTQRERLVTVGTLAAGIGHEINNPLSYVLSNLEFATDELRALFGGSPPDALKRVFDAIEEAKTGADNAKRIARGIRALAREDDELHDTDLTQAVELAVNMTMHELRPKAKVTVDLAPGLRARTNDARLTQVLVNLLANAAQAFRANDPNRNSVLVRGIETPEHVVLVVSDNGPGIAPEVLPRIFDPFFTTKAVGDGRGLGLSVSHSIMTSLEGQLSCSSAPDVGASFEIRLPRAEVRPSPAAEAPLDAGTTTSLELPQRRGRVLIVDDNQQVLKGQLRTLSKHHDVSGEHDPREALLRLERGERFDVVFCDMMMPYLGGPDLYERAVELDEAQARRFVFITGGVTQAGFERFLAEVDNLRLEKPVSQKSFREVVQLILERGAVG